MQISSKLFNEQQVRQFGKLNENIQDLQERVASGNNIIRASDDPVLRCACLQHVNRNKFLSAFRIMLK